MLMSEFYKELRNLKKKGFSFYNCLSNKLRCYKDNTCYCPLTAVCKSVTGKYYHIGDFDKAADDLKIRYREYWKICEASDCRDNHSAVVRKKLEEALNIK